MGPGHPEGIQQARRSAPYPSPLALRLTRLAIASTLASGRGICCCLIGVSLFSVAATAACIARAALSTGGWPGQHHAAAVAGTYEEDVGRFGGGAEERRLVVVRFGGAGVRAAPLRARRGVPHVHACLHRARWRRRLPRRAGWRRAAVHVPPPAPTTVHSAGTLCCPMHSGFGYWEHGCTPPQHSQGHAWIFQCCALIAFASATRTPLPCAAELSRRHACNSLTLNQTAAHGKL